MKDLKFRINRTKLNWILEEEKESLNNLLQRIQDGDLTRKAIENRIKEHIKKNELAQKFAKNL